MRKWIPIDMDTISEPPEDRSAKTKNKSNLPLVDSDEERILLVG